MMIEKTKDNLVKDIYNLCSSSILAGICISIGCVVNLMAGGGIPGAVLFTFGLIAVVHYKYALYTGTAGFVTKKDITNGNLFMILGGNILGCILMSSLITEAIPEIVSKCNAIVEARAQSTILQALIRSIFCGFLMTTAVKFAREGRWLPLLWAVPVFIIAGFYHSIADCFYISMVNIIDKQVFYNWLITIFGNFIGCNLYRLKFIDK